MKRARAIRQRAAAIGGLAFAVACTLAIMLAGCSRYVAGDVVPSSGPSGPAEATLRSLRLAGYEQASVAALERRFSPGGVEPQLRVVLPAVITSADLEVAWQTAIATLSVTYPRAQRYVVRIATDRTDLLEIRLAGDDARSAVAADDPSAIRILGSPVYLFSAEELAPASSVVAIDSQLALSYLDTKNRASGVLQADAAAASQEASAACAAMRASAEGVAAVDPGAGAARAWAKRAIDGLASQDVDGATELIARLVETQESPPPADVLALRALSFTVTAVGRGEPYGSVLAPAADIARAVDASRVSATSDVLAVRVAARDRTVPETARSVLAFEREPSLDASATPTPHGALLPQRVLAAAATRGTDPPALSWASPDGMRSAAPTVWLAYRRPDGHLFWLAGADGDVAISGAATSGWAYPKAAAEIVRSNDVGDVLVRIRLDPS